MKLRLTWKEFVAAAIDEIAEKHDVNLAVHPEFIKHYVGQPEGTMYDFPSYVEIALNRESGD